MDVTAAADDEGARAAGEQAEGRPALADRRRMGSFLKMELPKLSRQLSEFR